MKAIPLDIMEQGFIWSPELGIGYYPVKDQPYDQAYFDKYVAMENTPMGVAITQARKQLVDKYVNPNHTGTVLDIGIGSGAFVKTSPNFYGLDINPAAQKWLEENNKQGDSRGYHALTFWDSLEHIHDPDELLAQATRYVFISAPIYRDCYHVLGSKHFRKDEHCWYWTHEGLIEFMALHGFTYVEHNQMETELGREDIGTYVFSRGTI